MHAIAEAAEIFIKAACDGIRLNSHVHIKQPRRPSAATATP
jgi:hypothetical protein